MDFEVFSVDVTDSFSGDVDFSSSATSSDSGNEYTEAPDCQGMSEEQAAEQIYLAYRRHKRIWRRYTGRPTKTFRRSRRGHLKQRFPGRGKGFGKGVCFGSPQEGLNEQFAFPQGKGKGTRQLRFKHACEPPARQHQQKGKP